MAIFLTFKMIFMLNYEDIKLNGHVHSPYKTGDTGTIVSISNFASLTGIKEPIFTVEFNDKIKLHFGLKYILKNYIK